MTETLVKFISDQRVFRILIDYLLPKREQDLVTGEPIGSQHPVRLAFVLAAAVLLGFVVVYTLQSYSQRERPGKYFDRHRDYQRMPFDISDATSICKHKTELRFGEQLVRSYIDNHSTRFEPRLGIYKVFMSAQLGNLYVQEEAPVHCFVDPQDHMISHYRTFEKRQSLMTRAITLISFK